MRNFLIFLGITVVGYLAVIDTIDRFNELDRIVVTTPAQIEMKSKMQKSETHNAQKTSTQTINEGKALNNTPQMHHNKMNHTQHRVNKQHERNLNPSH